MVIKWIELTLWSESTSKSGEIAWEKCRIWMQVGLKFWVMTMFSEAFVIGWGFSNLKSPSGAWAYGTPRNWWTRSPFSSVTVDPTSVPELVDAVNAAWNAVAWHPSKLSVKSEIIILESCILELLVVFSNFTCSSIVWKRKKSKNLRDRERVKSLKSF